MVIIRGPQFSQDLGNAYALNTDWENATAVSIVFTRRMLVSETARIDRKAAAEMLALTLRPLIPAPSRLRPAAGI
jgi:hypothetical protein